MVHRLRLGVLAAAVVALAPAVAQALPDWVEMLDFSGYLQSDIRFEIENYRGATPGQGYAFQMNLNDLDLRLKVTPHAGVAIVLEPRMRFYGFVSNQTLSIADLSDTSKVDPFTLYLDSAYVSVSGMPFKSIDWTKLSRVSINRSH